MPCSTLIAPGSGSLVPGAGDVGCSGGLAKPWFGTGSWLQSPAPSPTANGSLQYRVAAESGTAKWRGATPGMSAAELGMFTRQL